MTDYHLVLESEDGSERSYREVADIMDMIIIQDFKFIL